MKSWIQTASGRAFDLSDPQPDMVDIRDIATALSRICRYTGHTSLTVAQHSIWVSQHCNRENAFAGLMHDATEAYIGDISSPLKRLLGDEIQHIEARVWGAIVAKWPALPIVLPCDVKRADLQALATERRDLLGPVPDGWAWFDMPEPHSARISPWPYTQHQMATAFMSAFTDTVR